MQEHQNPRTAEPFTRRTGALCGRDGLQLPHKPPLQSRHECCGDSGTSEQKNPEMRLKSEPGAYLLVRTENRGDSARHRAGSAAFGTVEVCFFQP